jgi:hypothetical protein
VVKKGKANPVTSRGGPEGFETSRLLYFVDSRLTNGGEFVCFTRRPPFTPKKIPGAHLCWRLSRPHSHSAAVSIRLIEKSNDLIVNRTRDLPACNIVPQPTILSRAPDT